MKANSVIAGVNIPAKQIIFRSENNVRVSQNGHDEFVHSQKTQSNKKTWWALGGVAALAAGALIAHKSGLFKKAVNKVAATEDAKFTNIEEAKKYFENLGIEIEFRSVTNEHLPQLNRIKDDLKQIKEMGVKIDKPDSITISDWTNAAEYEELCSKKGITIERKEEYFAFCAGAKNNKSHIFINSSKPTSDVFKHEMGHANHYTGHDSYWESKGIKNSDFANKQLELLGENIKVYDAGPVHDKHVYNIFHLSFNNAGSRFVFPTTERETRYIYTKTMLDKMQAETNCYSPDALGEQVAYVFDGLLKGKKYSDEVMLYYDFAGGARVPNLKIDGKSYDDYMESLYNNKELIAKLRENIKISKI